MKMPSSRNTKANSAYTDRKAFSSPMSMPKGIVRLTIMVLSALLASFIV
jgi:hypothetical protein